MEYAFLNDLVEKPISGEWGEGEGIVKVLRTTNFTNTGQIDFSDLVKRNIPAKKVLEKRLLKEDIIIEKSGGSPSQPVGRVVFFNENDEYLCNNFTSILRPIKSNVFPKYLHYILFCNHKYGVVRKYQNKTTGIINLKLANYLAETKIPLPPLAEQQTIAAILDAADSLRQKDQQLVERYTALSQSLFLEMFGDPVTNPMGWETLRISDVCRKVTDGTHQSPRFISEGIPFLLVSNIVNNQISFKTKKFISEVDYDALTKNTPIEKNDILYTSVGSYGNPAIVEVDTKFCFQRHIAHLKPNHQIINVKFLHSMLLSSYVKNQADKLARGVAQKTLNLKEIKSLEIYLPSFTTQNQFAERIQLIEAQKKQAQASLEKSEALFNSLLQRAFTGELTAKRVA